MTLVLQQITTNNTVFCHHEDVARVETQVVSLDNILLSCSTADSLLQKPTYLNIGAQNYPEEHRHNLKLHPKLGSTNIPLYVHQSDTLCSTSFLPNFSVSAQWKA